MGQSVDRPCGDQEMRPQQWSTTNLGWLIGFICLFTVSCQGDEHTEDDYYDLIPNPYRRSVYFSPIPYFTARSGGGGEWWNSFKRAPGSEFLGKRAPGSEFLGKRNDRFNSNNNNNAWWWENTPGVKRAPGSEFLGKRVPGSEFLGKRAPGSEFLGKRGHQLDYAHNVMQEANHPKGSLEVPLMPLQKNERTRFEKHTNDIMY